MGYLSIQNLYKFPQVIEKYHEWYALEKIHGTSSNISLSDTNLKFYSGGSSYDEFKKIFDENDLLSKYKKVLSDGSGKLSINKEQKVIIYGEAYGGKLFRMYDTYGPKLRFIAFDVNVDGTWLSVPDAWEFCNQLGLEFVSYKKITSTIEELNMARDEDSVQAIRNGMGCGKLREGIVIRPITEEINEHNNRVIFKHKRQEFSETRTERKIGGKWENKNMNLADQAHDWVTEMRLQHVMDKMLKKGIEETIPNVIQNMLEDIIKESHGELEISDDMVKQIKKNISILYRQCIKK